MVVQMVLLLLLLLVLELNCGDTGTGGASEALHEFFESGLVGLDEGGGWSCYLNQRGRGRRPLHDFLLREAMVVLEALHAWIETKYLIK
jgi:hypothetical protein